MTLVSVAEAKKHLRIDGDYDDADIQQIYIPAAEAYLEGAVDDFALKVLEPHLLAIAKLVCLVLVGEFYDNRELIDNRKRQPSYTVQALITQLQLAPAPIVIEANVPEVIP